MTALDHFPRTADLVTPAWLTSVLRVDGSLGASGAVETVRLSALGEGFGQTSDATRIHVTYRGTPGPASLVAKFATTDDARRTASTATGLYRTEIEFYRTVGPRISTRIPHCFVAEIDAIGEYFALVLEDFAEHRPGDETIGISAEDALQAVVQMARLHGPFWGQAELSGAKIGPQPPLDRLTEAWPVMAETFGAQLDPAVAAMRTAFLDSVPALHDWISSGPATLVHGDFRLDNLLFGPSGSPDQIVVLDWQAVHIGKGMQDFAYLVTHSMNTADRRAAEASLLDAYLAELATFGVAYDPHQARSDYALAMLYVFCHVLWITGVNVNAHERALRRKRSLVQRAGQALLDADALALLPFS